VGRYRPDNRAVGGFRSRRGGTGAVLCEGDATGGTDGGRDREAQRQRVPGRTPVDDRFDPPVDAAVAVGAGTAVGGHAATLP
jgi:hypothetical protein